MTLHFDDVTFRTKSGCAQDPASCDLGHLAAGEGKVYACSYRSTLLIFIDLVSFTTTGAEQAKQWYLIDASYRMQAVFKLVVTSSMMVLCCAEDMIFLFFCHPGQSETH